MHVRLTAVIGLMAVVMAAVAKTETSSTGQYTTKLTCTCGATSYGNDHWNKKLGGWKCAHCQKEHSR